MGTLQFYDYGQAGGAAASGLARFLLGQADANEPNAQDLSQIANGSILKASVSGGLATLAAAIASTDFMAPMGPPTATVGADTASVTLSGLAGDTDGCYLLVAHIVNNSGASPVYTLRPNGITANQGGQRTSCDTSVAASQRTDLCLSFTGAGATEPVRIFAIITSKSGVNRHVIARAAWKGSLYQTELCTSDWADTATVISDLRPTSSLAAGIGAGSKFWLQKLGISGL